MNPIPFAFKHKVVLNETLPQFLERIHEGEDDYYMDFSLYAQLASLVLRRKWGCDFALFIPAEEDFETCLWMTKIPEMVYIGIFDPETSTFLRKLPVSFKRQWVIQIGENKFLGLTANGPCIQSMEEWVSHLRTKLEEYSHSESDSSFSSLEGMILNRMDTIRKSLLQNLFEKEKMNTWGFYTSQGVP